MQVDEALLLVDEILQPEHLSDAQELVFRQVWDGQTYEAIAQHHCYDTDYVKHVGAQIWRSLSQSLQQKVTKSNVRSILRQVQQQRASSAHSPPPSPLLPTPTHPVSQVLEDWGDAPDVSAFYGRVEELKTLQQWIVVDRCRLITLMGMGGIGKTTLSIHLARQLAQAVLPTGEEPFHFVIWRSLRNAPPLLDLLADVIEVLAHSPSLDLPATSHGRINLLMTYLRSSRCLLVLDNGEAILAKEGRAGHYREGYEDYGQFLDCMGETRHRSCLILTSREKPRGLGAKEGNLSPVRSLQLTGLSHPAGQAILETKGVSVTTDESQTLVAYYAGNPLALRMVATTIQELFNGNVTQFLQQRVIVFGDISDLLDQQFNRLSPLEQQVMYWLAINREWVLPLELQADMVPPATLRSLLEALESLQQRSLIEKVTASNSTTSFTQQPVVMEYVTERLIGQVCEEIYQGKLGSLNRYALIKAQSKDYLRNAQIHLILKPITDNLLRQVGRREKLKDYLTHLLTTLKAAHQDDSSQSTEAPTDWDPAQPSGYAAGNLLNFLVHLQIKLDGYDVSPLPVWQAYLQGVDLHRVNFAHADLSKSVFTQTLGGLLSAAFSPDGHWLAMGIDQQIWLWHPATMQHQRTCEGHGSWVQTVAFAPVTAMQGSDRPLLVSGSHDQTVRLWDIETGQCLKTLRGHRGSVQAVAFSSDGRILASGSDDQTVRLWDTQTGQCLRILTGHMDRLLALIVMPDGHTLISGSEDQTVRLWDMPSGACLRVLETHINWRLAIALSPDGKTLAIGSEGNTVKFWDVTTGHCTHQLPHYHSHVWTLAYAPGTQDHPPLLATGGEDRTVKLWNAMTGTCLQTLQGHGDRVWFVSFSPDGSTLLSASENQTIKLWERATGHCLRTLEGYNGSVLAVAFSPDGQYLASSGQDQRVRVWAIATGACEAVLQGHSTIVSALTFTSQAGGDQRLISGSDDQTIKVWDWRGKECLRTLWGHSSWVQSLSLSPDGCILASGSRDHTVKLWDWHTGECLQTLDGHSQRVKAVAFSADGSRLASASDDQTVKLWAVGTGLCLQTLQGHQDGVLSVAFSPAGHVLASGGGDQQIHLWDPQTGERLNTLMGHLHRVRSLGFSPDGSCLASASDDGQIRLWEMPSGTCQRSIQAHQTMVWAIAFHPQEPSLASASGDETIKLWDLETGACLRTFRAERPYEGMNIHGAIGITPAQRATLKALGAVELP